MKESDVRHDIYKMLQTYKYWPIHGRDAMICQYCFKPIVNFEQGRPDLLVLSPTGRCAVIEVKAVNLNTSKSLPLAHIAPNQHEWLDNWLKAAGFGYLAVGTVGTMKRQIWIIDWMTWLGLERRVADAGKKSVSIERLTSDYAPYELPKITGGWELPKGHNLITYAGDQ
jgi:hypothetical protein